VIFVFVSVIEVEQKKKIEEEFTSSFLSLNVISREAGSFSPTMFFG
jgi:hypothetical protein